MIVNEVVRGELEPIGRHRIQHSCHASPPPRNNTSSQNCDVSGQMASLGAYMVNSPERLLTHFCVHILRAFVQVWVILQFAARAHVVAHMESA